MREIKFRAWDNQSKVMMLDYQWFDSSNPHMGGGHHRNFKFSRNGRSTTSGSTASAYHNVMQYTGLKDKNGVEIYEGDIVSLCEVWDRGDGFYDDALAVVEWCKEFNAYRTKEIGQDDWFYLCDHDLIVIGNIYETPELIEQ
jgi:uncharacterized phage protein (TIGR01671 family)